MSGADQPGWRSGCCRPWAAAGDGSTLRGRRARTRRPGRRIGEVPRRWPALHVHEGGGLDQVRPGCLGDGDPEPVGYLSNLPFEVTALRSRRPPCHGDHRHTDSSGITHRTDLCGSHAPESTASRCRRSRRPLLLHSIAHSRKKRWEGRQPSCFTCSRW